MKKDRVCKHCKVLFKDIEGNVFANHVRWCSRNPNRRKKKKKSESDRRD